MAAKLQCEICGGKLVGKPGGIFECENCGTEYSTEWAKAKIQEITGTVKVEGTVEVQGKVQVEGTANKESLLKRGYLALEDNKWDDARKFFDEALNADAECAEAYLGLAMAKLKLHNTGEIGQIDDIKKIGAVEADGNYNKFLRFASEGQKKSVEDLLAGRRAAIAEARHRSSAVCAEHRAALKPAQGHIATGERHTVGLKLDGTVVAVGDNDNGQCNVTDWTDIVAVSAGGEHTVGLKSDGTVVAVGSNNNGQCDVTDWHDIVAVATGKKHTVGLKMDGTVTAVGLSMDGRCKVNDWTDIVAVSAGFGHTVGLRSDGTVVSTRSGDNVSNWTDIVAVSAGVSHTAGLCSDGTVVDTGSLFYRMENLHDIVAVSAGRAHTTGLRSDGTVVAVYKDDYHLREISDWKEIVAVAVAEDTHTVGLRSDGTVAAKGLNLYGECNVTDWKLFNSLDTLEQERAAARERAGRERKEAAEKQRKKLTAEKTALQTELSNIKGMFAGKRKKEIETRLAAIEAELGKLR